MRITIAEFGRRRVAVVTAIGLVVTACSDVPLPTGANAGQHTAPNAPARSTEQDRFRTADEEEARIAREEVPGYAGSVLEKDGTRTILMADTSDLATRLTRLRGHFDRQTQHPIGGVRKVDYNFDELKRVRDVIVSRGLGSARWSIFDVDEQANRVVVGVVDAAQIGPARAALRELGVSDAMVTVLVVPPVVPDIYRPSSCSINMTNCGGEEEPPPPSPAACIGLQCKQLQLVGGLLMDFVTASGIRPEVPCTVGALAWFAGQHGIVTAGHCSANLASFDGTSFTQGLGSTTVVATELWDRAATANPSWSPCPSGYGCRWSDALFAKLAPNAPSIGGYIARTTYRNVVDTNQARQLASLQGTRIVSQRTYLNNQITFNEPVVKVGHRTGTTDGVVSRTCIDIWYGLANAQGQRVMLLCQYEVQPPIGFNFYAFHSGVGDSGAPVYSQTSGGAMFYGILTAGVPNPYTPLGWSSISYVFSPIDQVQLDLQNHTSLFEQYLDVITP